LLTTEERERELNLIISDLGTEPREKVKFNKKRKN